MNIITIEKVSKSFKIPHEKRNSVSERFIGFFSRKRMTYETISVLKKIDLTIEEGDFVGIIGRNGSGKSTLLKIITGVLVPDSGQIKVQKKISPLLELGIGFNGELTAKENIYLYGAILGLSRKEITTKFNDIIHFAEIEQFVDTKVKYFSSGMYIRLAFATAMQVDAPIIIVDEVLAVGDFRFQDKCKELFRNYKQQGKTIIYVSHDLPMMTEFCNKIILMEKGEIIYSGSPEKVISYYLAQA